MRQSFSGYYKDEDLADILKKNNIIIVLDSSVLCNLFGLHDEVWKFILEMIKEKRDILWLPYNIATNYHKGILSILVQKIQLLVSLKNKLHQTAELLKGLPFDIFDKQNYLNKSEIVSRQLTREIARLKQRGKKDSEIREQISNLYQGRVGVLNNDPSPQSFRISTYNEVTETDGLSRTSIALNSSTTNEQVQITNYNDIILHTLINLSNDKNKNILYVISEPSEYWSVFIGNTSYGPNPEHQTYFTKSTNGKKFYCCTFASFMRKLADSLDKSLPTEILNNINKITYGTKIQNDESERF